MTPETRYRISILQQKAIDGTLTLDEMREGVKLMREDRTSGASSSDSSRRAKAKAVIKSADDMLDELGSI